MRSVTILLWAFAFLAACFGADDDLVVKIGNGKVKGMYLESRNGRRFRSFTGIPYAKPPIGELRFKNPEPAENWNEVREPVTMDIKCIQNLFITEQIDGVEDCLVLHVYVPEVEIKEKLPVMVFIHGGAFYCGEGSFSQIGPQFIMDEDVIMVSINYRLGPLGFLTTGDSVVPGNAGLKDQILALKWVQENIDSFGGNPDSVTIFGESAGGGSVHLLTLSPLSKGLFHRAIVQSGTAYCPWVLETGKEGRALTEKLAEVLDCPSGDSQEMVECLRSKSASEMIAARKHFMIWEDMPMIVFKPTIEVPHEGAFLDAFPEDILKSGRGMDIPIMFGVTQDEGCLLAAPLYLTEGRVESMEKDFDRLALIGMGYTNADMSEVMPDIRKFYFGDRKLTEVESQQVMDLFSDGMFAYCTDQALTAHRQYLKHPAYYYMLAHEGPFSVSMLFGDTKRSFGVCHGEDMQFLFKSALMPGNLTSEADLEVSEFFVTRWTNFAKYGNPNRPDSSSSKFPKWEPATNQNEYMYIEGKTGIRMKADMFKERMEFWRSIKLDRKTRTLYWDEL